MGKSRARSTNHRPAQQAQPIAPEGTRSMSDFTRPPDTKARFMFLLALRVRMPPFWETLHAGVWKAGTPEALFWWKAQWNVVDDWLLDVVRDTLEYWGSEPESPDAALNPAYKWFLYRPLLRGDQKSFQLVLENPRPIEGELAVPLKEWAQLLPVSCLHPSAPNARTAEVAAALESGQSESIEEFKARVLRTCEAQLREYEKDFHRRLTLEREPEMLKHAVWTVARFCGAGYVEIADATPGMRWGHAMFPNKAVSMGVRRFAERIGLTLTKER